MRRLALLLALAAPAMAEEFTTLKGHGGPIMALAVGPEGQVASASFDNSVGLWEGRTPTWLEGHAAAVTALAFGPDGTLYSGGDDFALRVWGAAPRELGRHLGKVSAVAVAPDGRVVTGSWDGSIRLWGAEGFETLAAPGAGVNGLALSPDGAVLYAATSGGAVLRYELNTDRMRPLVRHGFGVNRVVAGSGWVAYGAVDGGTRIVDAVTGAPIADRTLERRPILALAHHAGTGQLAVGDGDGWVMILDTRDWRIARDFRAAREGPVWALAFSPDGRTLYAGGLDDAVHAWPVALLDAAGATIDGRRSFLRDADSMPNGERQFMRKCSICHALEAGPSRKAGPTLHGLFGRPAGTVPGYRYSEALTGAGIVWSTETVDALFDQGPDHYVPDSKMPMQVIAAPSDRADLIAFLQAATRETP